MYVHKDLQKCKYCSAHKCLPLRLPGKVASGHKLVTISAAEANNEVKYICMCEECKTLALNHVPLKVWWYQFPSASSPLSSAAGVTSGSLLLLPTPWMSVHFTGQRLPEQSRWARSSFCCTGLSKYSNYAEICLKWRCCWNPGKGAQTESLQCSIEWRGPVWSMNALVLPSSQQYPMPMLLRKSSRRDNSQYRSLQVYVFGYFCDVLTGRVTEGPCT